MKMLESVRLDPHAEVVRPQPASKPHETVTTPPSQTRRRKQRCTNCGSQEPWGDSSWCPNCGFYPKLGRKVFSAAEVAPEEEEEIDAGTLLSLVPAWAYWIVGGVTLLLATSLTIRLTVGPLAQRSAIAILQILIGINVLGLAHFRAYYHASQENEDLNFLSLVWSPFVIWKSAFARMPDVRKTFYAGSWGFAAIIFAILLIGLDYDNIFHPDNFRKRQSFNPLKLIVQLTSSLSSAQTTQSSGTGSPGTTPMASFLDMAKEAAPTSDGPSQAQDIGEAIGGFAGQSGLTGNRPGSSVSRSDSHDEPDESGAADSKPDPTPVDKTTVPLKGERKYTNEYVIFGYLTNSSNELRSVLLAEVIPESNAARFVGKYSVSLPNQEVLGSLQKLLESVRTRRPAMNAPYHAKWTAPVIVCEIAHDGVTPDGRFEEAQIISFHSRVKLKSSRRGGKQ